MKKIITLCLLAFLGISQVNATDYVVSGASSSQFNGTYTQQGTSCDGYTFYVKNSGGSYYAIQHKYGSYWMIGQISSISNPCNSFKYSYLVNSNNATPPATGYGGSITVEIASAKISYSATQFVENSNNDGSISNSITIAHNNFGGATFAGTNGENFITSGKVTVGNVPAGLTASVIRNNSLSLTISLAGNATAHNNANDISNLSVVFQNSAFSNNNAAGTVNYNSNLSVNFIQVLSVGTGQTYTTIASAISAASNYDVLSLAAETFTESGIAINNKSLTIMGQSPTQTIIQANANAGAANDRVFNISFSTYVNTNNINFEKVTIRNGYAVHYGGGILASQANVNFLNCSVESNYAYTTVPDAYYGDGGGAIRVADGSFSATGTTFYNNRHNSVSNRPGDFMGGGAVTWFGQPSYGNTMIITNCTFSNNYCGQYGAAILIRPTDNDIKIINSTFNGNDAGISGGVAYFGGASSAASTNFKNSIFYGNTATSSGPEFASSFSMTFNATNCIIDNNTSIGSMTGNFTNCIIGQNPLLGSLANNGGYTKTYAIPANSPAANAGASGADVPATDQRGQATIGVKDIGSYESLPCVNTSSTTNVSICTSVLPYSWNGSRTAAGTYTFTTTNSQGCDSVATLNLTVLATQITPSVSISTASASVCDNASATFTASTSTGGASPVFQWKRNGTNAGSGSSISFLAGVLTTGDVISCVLTANNVCQTTATANSNTITVTVKASPSVAQITNGISTITSASLCTLGNTYNYYNATPYGTWSSSDPSVASVTGGSQAGVVTANTNGTATISYNVAAANGCVSTSSILVTAAQQTAPTAITGTNSICVGATSALSSTAPVGTTGVWSSSNDRGIINASGVYTANNAGTWGEARYTVTNAAGCKAFASYAITVNPTPVVPTITYAVGTSNPQAGAPTGSFCVGKTFGIVGTPNVPAGVWSSTGATSITSGGIVTINAVGAGSIKYTYTDVNGCSNSRTMSGNGYSCAARGVNTVDGQLLTVNDFTMYPNPAKGLINLNVETLIGAGSIVITDLYGKQVKTQNLSMGSNTVNIANLSKGMYFVSTITNEGKTTKKLVVE